MRGHACWPERPRSGGEIDDPLEQRDGFGENALLTLIELVRQAFGQPILLHCPGFVEGALACVADRDDALPSVIGVRCPVRESLSLKAGHDRAHGLRPRSLSAR
jgi:hypothetical protein